MHKRLLACLGIILLFGCSTFSIGKTKNPDAQIDAVARTIRKKLLKNYDASKIRTLAVASFSRLDTGGPSKTYKRIFPKLGTLIGNALNNELFNPKKFNLVERTRIDAILKETAFNKSGLMNPGALKSSNLKGVDIILLGTLHKRADSIQISARIVDIKSATVLSLATGILPLNDYVRKAYYEHPESKKSCTGNIYAYKGWQTIDCNLPKTGRIKLSAKGSWSMTSSGAEFGPEGIPQNPSFFGGDFRISKSFKHGQLLCRITNMRDFYFPVDTEVEISNGGLIECRINDSDTQNNVGAQVLSIDVHWE